MTRARRLGISVAIVALVASTVLLWQRSTGAATPVLRLLSDGAPSATVGVGSPVFLEVFLHGRRNSTGPSIGGRLRPWHRLITIAATQNGREVALPFVELSPPHVRELETESDGRPTVTERESAGAALDGLRRVFRMDLAAAPESTRQLSAGAYEVVASLQPPFWQFWGWRGRVESAPLVVTVVTDPAPIQELAGTATFLYKTKRFDEAVRAARDWTTREAASVRARVLLGDALLETGDRDGARSAYEAALELANARPSNERPTVILDRLASLRAGADGQRR